MGKGCNSCAYSYKENYRPPCCFCEGLSKWEPNETTNLRAALTTAREENERLTAENATLRASVAGKTFFHSDEEVNAEMGRLRAKVERYGKALAYYERLKWFVDDGKYIYRVAENALKES